MLPPDYNQTMTSPGELMMYGRPKVRSSSKFASGSTQSIDFFSLPTTFAKVKDTFPTPTRTPDQVPVNRTFLARLFSMPSSPPWSLARSLQLSFPPLLGLRWRSRTRVPAFRFQLDLPALTPGCTFLLHVAFHLNGS